MRLVISYSHKDEGFRKQFETHLALLKRNKLIEHWDDRKIIPGDEWEEEIDQNFRDAGIVILMVSPDFLSSDYCYQKEMATAFERHERGEVAVVPIILRSCDWEDAPFGKLQALPAEAKPVSLWSDRDQAWLNVVHGLKSIVKRVKEERSFKSRQMSLPEVAPAGDFKEWLEDTEIELRHRRVEKVRLSNIFVWPDLKVLDEDAQQYSHSISSRESLSDEACVLIFGSEQSGKTSLAKAFVKDLIRRGYFPIYINGDEIKKAEMDSLLEKRFNEQYPGGIGSSSPKNKVLIIDDFSKTKLNKKYQNIALSRAKALVEKVVLIDTESFQYVAREIDELDDFRYFEILGFGNAKRTELIERWVSLGVVEEIDEQELYAQVDDFKMRVEGLARGNMLPSKPIYLLTILQMFESVTPQKVELTSYGHCYQYLIYQALEKAKIRNTEVDVYINFLTEFGCAQFANGGFGLTPEKLRKFHDGYEEKYLSIDLERLIEVLIRSGILVRRDGLLSFKYSYIYYFFTAKKLAESVANDETARRDISRLLDNLHREDCANIIIFITHHSKDNWILDEIQMCMMDLFSQYEEATLDSSSLAFMADFISDIPELVIEHRRVDDERRRHDQELDELEERQKEMDDQAKDLEPSAFLAKINRVFKGIEIIGQIIRNRHGSLSKEKLEELASQAYGVGLRFLQYFINISDVSKDEVVKIIENLLEKNPNVDNAVLEKEARNIFLFITYGAIYGVLRKVSAAVGSREAEKIYRNLEDRFPTPAVKLINQAIYLQFNKSLDTKALSDLSEEFRKNPTCIRILREFVVQHIYMFPVDYRKKQQVAQTLNIPVADQIGIGSQKTLKV